MIFLMRQKSAMLLTIYFNNVEIIYMYNEKFCMLKISILDIKYVRL